MLGVLGSLEVRDGRLKRRAARYEDLGCLSLKLLYSHSRYLLPWFTYIVDDS